MPTETEPFAPPDRDRMRRKVFAILSSAGLEGREDRCALATFVLQRTIKSFTELDNRDWARIVDACCGYVAFVELRRLNGKER